MNVEEVQNICLHLVPFTSKHAIKFWECPIPNLGTPNLMLLFPKHPVDAFCPKPEEI